MSKHWKAERSKYGLIIWTTGGKQIARVLDEKEAPLIAAAPDLLEACKGLVVILENDPDYAPATFTCASARAAISKAEGDS